MSEWRTFEVRDVTDVFDGPHATPEKISKGPWFLSISSLSNGRLNLAESAHLSQEDFVRWTRRVTPQEGDVLFSYETRLGEAALMPAGVQACLGRRMGLLRPKREKIDPRFLLYAYIGPQFQEVIKQRSIHGATVDRIPLTELLAWPIAIPSLSEQRAIAAVLGALDDKIAVNERIATALDSLSMNLYHDFFAEHARESRETWRECTLADLCSTQYGYTARADADVTGPKFLRVTDINKKNWIDWSSVPRCPEPGGTKAKYSLTVGDIVVARMADPGKAAIIEQEIDAVFASYLVRLKTESLAHAYYVYGFLKSAAYSEYTQGAKSGSVQANMNAKTIVGAKISIPPVALMESYLASVLPLRQKIAATVHESLALVGLRDTLLPGLMSGAIRVREAEKAAEDAK